VAVLNEIRPVRLHSSHLHFKTCSMIGVQVYALTAVIIPLHLV